MSRPTCIAPAYDLLLMIACVAMGGLCSVICLNRFTFGLLFDREARSQGTYPACGGHGCTSTALLVLLGFNVTAVGASWGVHVLRSKMALNAASARVEDAGAVSMDQMRLE